MSDLMIDFPKYRKWAVVGASTDTTKYGYKIYQDLKNAGYTVFAVNPKLNDLNGDPVYATVKDLPEIPDVVDMVVPPVVAEQVIDDCLEMGIQRVWFQPGSESSSAIDKAKEGGMQVVYDACIMIQKQAWV